MNAPATDAVTPDGEWVGAMARQMAAGSRPRHRDLHLLEQGTHAQLLVVNGSRLYNLPADLADRFRRAMASTDEASLQQLLEDSGLLAAPQIDDQPLPSMPAHALSLAVAQKCNLGCAYCYAQQGAFGGAAKNMSADTALRAIDMLVAGAEPGSRINLAFMGGEPLQNREVIRLATRHARQQADARQLKVGFSLTTNGTLLTPDDASFFEEHGFAMTVSLDGPAAQHDALRPFKSGRGSFERIIERLQPLLASQRQMQVSARVTVTPFNLDLPDTLDLFVGMGFHSVGFSPLLHASNGQAEMDPARLAQMLQGMVACGLRFEQHVLAGQRYPFLNMVNALRELHRGSHRPYPCGAGAGYLGVSAEGQLSACHRFVDDANGQFGNLANGVDTEKQAIWLRQRHVHQQSPCRDCWARYLCGGGCHHEVLARGRSACDYIRGWLHYTIQAYGRLSTLAPGWFAGHVPQDSAQP